MTIDEIASVMNVDTEQAQSFLDEAEADIEKEVF